MSRVSNAADRIIPALRTAGWSAVAVILLAPAVAMRFTDEVRWTASDFLFAGLMLGGAGVLAELAVRRSVSWAYRLGAGVAIATAVMQVRAAGAVGVIGSEADAVNLAYPGMAALVLVAGVLSRFRARGLMWSAIGAAVGQALIGVTALLMGWDRSSPSWPADVAIVTLIFAGLWLTAAACFRRASRG